jgi:inner membrane protein
MAGQDIFNIVSSIIRSPFVKVILVGFLVLIIQIPVTMIELVIGERQVTRDEAVSEVTGKWGAGQNVSGPFLVVPYYYRWQEKHTDGSETTRQETRYAYFLPETLDIASAAASEVRYRGIYKVPVYVLSVDVKARFKRPDFSDFTSEMNDVQWDRAWLSVQISDVRAIVNPTKFTWNSQPVEFLPSSGEASSKIPGIHAPLKGLMTGDTFDSTLSFKLDGSMGAFFAPLGRETSLAMTSNWPDPSFQGSWLPRTKKIDEKGFEASWNISFLGRSFPQQWIASDEYMGQVMSSLVGVNFVVPVDHYRMAQRSVKYEFLFVFLTFATLWLFEILVRRPIHPLQYLLVGAGMCMFYLLELSLAEHIGFDPAYILASLAVVLLIFFYSIAVLKRVGRASVMGGVIAILYAYLYILLINQDYALLVGSLGLFAALALVMYLTRKIDWYTYNQPPVE